ncbi:hypothetical protein TIFTF001_035946 [Ficus carica]|uniref:Uncharacterized protein n=1 Tax=Ficus carica TaxID=3494 RepID=A0AA88E5V3_FICCA|nr:hypothetical protein TIFTF001_035946 [Ficus carica]
MQLRLQALVFSNFDCRIHSPLHQLPPPPAATTDSGFQRLTALHLFDSNQIMLIGFFMATGTISWEPIPSVFCEKSKISTEDKSVPIDVIRIPEYPSGVNVGNGVARGLAAGFSIH